jgi:hypothetical protein
MTPSESAERLMVGPRMNNTELTQNLTETSKLLNELAVNHASLHGGFESHIRHCATDKAEIKTELAAINNKIVAVLIFTVVNLLAVSGYLVVNGQPWIKEAQAQTK